MKVWCLDICLKTPRLGRWKFSTTDHRLIDFLEVKQPIIFELKHDAFSTQFQAAKFGGCEWYREHVSFGYATLAGY
jgi:hypothetical protein